LYNNRFIYCGYFDKKFQMSAWEPVYMSVFSEWKDVILRISGRVDGGLKTEEIEESLRILTNQWAYMYESQTPE